MENATKLKIITGVYIIVMLGIASKGIYDYLMIGGAESFRWVYGSIFALLLGSIPFFLYWKFKMDVPWILSLLICISLFLHIGGGVFEWYHSIPYYDHITHFISGFLVAFLAFTAIYILDKYWEGLHMDTSAMVFMVIIFSMAMGVTWEIIEFSMDQFLGTNEQFDGLYGTMLDLIFDTLAGIITALIGVLLLKYGEMQSMTNNFGKQVDEVLIHKKE